jgi:hypothetical protein
MTSDQQPSDIGQQQALWRNQLADLQRHSEADPALQARLDAIRRAALTTQRPRRQRWLALAASLGAVAVALPLLLNTGPDIPALFVTENYLEASGEADNPLALYGELDHYQWFVLGE